MIGSGWKGGVASPCTAVIVRVVAQSPDGRSSCQVCMRELVVVRSCRLIMQTNQTLRILRRVGFLLLEIA